VNQGLESWLVWATQDLATSESIRIRQEISNHFDDARDGLVVAGMSLEEAERQAVQALGSPQQANAEFLRVCFTETDERRLERLMARSWWTLPCGLLGLVVFGFSLLNGTGFIFSDPQLQLHVNANFATPLLSLWIGALLLEPQVKRLLVLRFPKRATLLVQGFMVLLGAVNVISALEEAIQPLFLFSKGTLSIYFGSWMFVLILTYRWLRAQLPLTLKSLKRISA
jgi:hypothetical protein